jgi:hypothetical protein
MLRAGHKRAFTSGTVMTAYRPNGAVIPSALLSGTNAYLAAVLADSPALYMRLEEVAGTTCADASASGFTGTASAGVNRNIASHAGIGIGVSFAANTDKIDVPDNAALDITGDVTYEFWLNYSSRAAAQMLVGKGFKDASNAGYQLWLDGSGGFVFERSSLSALLGGGSGGSNTVPNDSAWHHCVITRIGTACTAWVDGVHGTGTTTSQAIQATDNPLMVGASFYNSVGSRFAGLIAGGKMDEIAIYNTGLSAARVAAHFAAAV